MIRCIAEELERIAMHIAGLAGVANDIGFAIVASAYGKYRTLIINTLALLCGSRFGRGLFVYGGVRFDFDNSILEKVIENLETVKSAIPTINDYLFTSTGAMLRFEETGIVTHDYAKRIGLVGMSGRASGVEIDTRKDFTYGAYLHYPISIVTLDTCDVFSRARVRALEMEESFRIVFTLLKDIPKGEIKTVVGKPLLNSGVISMVEGWRGEVLHIGLSDEQGNIIQYKIKDPSFNNWYGLSLALRRVAISDFPLCNKSFDLSYAGHDL
jgi:Ni,Fe-hydrogenase III large subunit